jgi:RHS repeat-associated protein
MSSAGGGSSAYGFTGEMTDANGLIYLRARYYASDMGRFVSRDTWSGRVNRPMSFNRWNYTDGNPVNRVDPNGNCFTSGWPWANDWSRVSEQPQNGWCLPDAVLNRIESIENSHSNITIYPENWTIEELNSVETSLAYMTNTLGGADNFNEIINKNITLYRNTSTFMTDGKQGQTAVGPGTITFYNDAFASDTYATTVIIHEFGHLVDAKYGHLSMEKEFRNQFWSDCVPNTWNDNCSTAFWQHNPKCTGIAASSYACTGPREDFADLFAYYVLVDNDCDNSLIFKDLMPPDTNRIDYMNALIQQLLQKLSEQNP